jgi:hypothetical protein
VNDVACPVSKNGAREVRVELASVFLAAMLLGGAPVVAQAQAVGAAAPLIVDGSFEMIGWTADKPDEKFRDLCSATAGVVACHMQTQIPYGVLKTSIRGTLHGNQIVSRALLQVSQSVPECTYTSETALTGTINLSPDGKFTNRWTSGPTSYTSVTGPCAATLPRTTPPGPPSDWIGTWRQLTTGLVPLVTVTPDASGTSDGKSLARIEGNTIYVTDGSGTGRVVALVTTTKASPPVFNPPTVSGEAKALEKYLMTNMYEASYGHLPPELRSTFLSGMRMPSDVAGEAAQAVLDAGESAANWLQENRAEVGLMILSTAVSVAFPLSAFANPAVATGGAAVLRGVVGTAMVAGTAGFVQSLFKTFLTTQSTGERVVGAIAKGAGDAVATVPSSLVGAGVEKVAEQIIAKAAVTAGSVAVGIATDKAMEKLQVSEKTAALVIKAPSYASSLLTLPGPSPEPGGMSLNFDR